MKKLLAICLLATIVVSCEQPTYNVHDDVVCGNVAFKVLVIDECEYVYHRRGHNIMFAHKGNCSNPKHTIRPIVVINKDTIK